MLYFLPILLIFSEMPCTYGIDINLCFSLSPVSSILDVCVERDENVLKTTVFRKKTHTGQYLNFTSNHQKTVKVGVAYSLFDRAKSLCSNENSLKSELKDVENDLLKKGYTQSTDKEVH